MQGMLIPDCVRRLRITLRFLPSISVPDLLSGLRHAKKGSPMTTCRMAQCVVACVLSCVCATTSACERQADVIAPPQRPTSSPMAATEPPGAITVSTDYPHYAQGEWITLTVINGADRPIWYAQHVDCGLSFWVLAPVSSAEMVHYAVPCVWEEPDYRFSRLDPGEMLQDVWRGSHLVAAASGWVEQPAGPGDYEIRFPYSWEAPDPGWHSEKEEAVSPVFVLR